MARKSTGKRLRFEIFKRDGFRCRYCGADPVKTVLQIDHVIAVANGGTNEPDNLVTACRECNAGKSAVPLDTVKYATQADAETVREQTEQLRDFLALQKELADAQREAAGLIAAQWEASIGPMTQGMFDRIPGLMREWSLEKLAEAMAITARKQGTTGVEFDSYRATSQAKYFHGILRRWRSEAA